jgi:uncharacterized membrane protein YccC
MPVVFPAWARIGLGLLVALAGLLVVSLHADESTKQLVVSLTALLAAQGIVPPVPGQIHLSPVVNLLLTVVAVVGAYFLTGASIDEPLHSILTAVLLVVTSVVITPAHAKTQP